MNALNILVFNSGSSSLKFSFFCMESPLLEGEIEFHKNNNNFYVKDSNASTHLATISVANHTDAALHIVRYIASLNTPTPDAIAHRVVHGGQNLHEHCLINDKVLRELNAMSAFAPLHNQAALEIIKFSREKFPKLPQIACFDTTFHAHMPELARVLPIAKELQQSGIQRYGFHGLSCESIVSQLNNAAHLRTPKRLIIAHLGNGASVIALKNGQSVDTSMGLTPSGGVMMGTRCGDIDPGVLIYLMREKKYDCAALEALINHQSGLLGISGLSSDMRVLHDAAATNHNAQLAIDMFCYGVAKQIGAMITVLNGIDALVFTGGIGEHDAIIRQLICDYLDYLKIVLDDEKNQEVASENIHTISEPTASCAVRVISSQENAQIARHAAILLNSLAA
jgi:acetate kinase